MESTGIETYLNGDDPLALDAARFLVDYNEEDDRADYKESFDPSAEKQWLEITKDISAFANTFGGYLVFGVSDKSRELVGIDAQLAEKLEDVNNTQQKLNRHLEPHIQSLRAKRFELKGKLVVIWMVPASIGVTHLISKDGAFTQPSKERKTILRQGTFYVRRSASNHLGDSRDFDAVIERRIDQFREALIDKVARVVKSPPNSEVYILSEDPDDTDVKRFVVTDAPDAIEVKGKHLVLPPQGPSEEIAAWSALLENDVTSIPPERKVLEWYALREELKLSARHSLYVFTVSLWTQMPAFYWIRDIGTESIQEALLAAARYRPHNFGVPRMLAVASFVGKGFYSKLLKALGDYRERLTLRQKSYPAGGGMAEYWKFSPAHGQTLEQVRRQKLIELNDSVRATTRADKKPAVMTVWRIMDLDCFVYARQDKYPSKSAAEKARE